jgi:hypothetical protein
MMGASQIAFLDLGLVLTAADFFVTFSTRPEAGKRKGQKKLLPQIIQRRRQDVEKWLGSDTPFPNPDPQERHYQLAGDYHKLFNDVLDYCREAVEAGRQLRAPQQRVRHWEAIALLRCQLSSPAAAANAPSSRSRCA